jgi:streptomycin 3"-adenylyltransferase
LLVHLTAYAHSRTVECETWVALERRLPTIATLDPHTREQVRDVIDLVREVLGDDALGAFLHGSAVHGGLKPSSDLDVLVVSTRATTPGDKRALIGRLLGISGSHATGGPARSIELSIVAQPDVRPWRYPPNLDFQYGDWLRAEFERGELTPWPNPNPDLAIVLTAALSGAEPLFGPPAVELLDPVPHADLVRAMVDGVPDLLADLESDTRNVILTLARIWTTMATGAIRSKDAAADWVLARLPEEQRAVLTRARANYLGDEPERWDDLGPRVRSHAEHVVREIETLTHKGNL